MQTEMMFQMFELVSQWWSSHHQLVIEENFTVLYKTPMIMPSNTSQLLEYSSIGFPS